MGDIDLTLIRADAPCLLHSLASLITQGFYSWTSCLRDGTAAVRILSCGVRNPPVRTGYTTSTDPTNRLSEWPAGSVAMARSDGQTSDGRISISLGAIRPIPGYSLIGGVLTDLKALTSMVTAAGGNPAHDGTNMGRGSLIVSRMLILHY